ncbi:hypothetical protein OAU51_00170 [Porticoccaceae bacterium]|jgi:hypothetical protein|nr:hypothetical protein [Porticoccaceae bacterium]
MTNALSSAKLICITSLLLCANVFGACDFDTDDADSPNFMDRIIDCEKQPKSNSNPSKSVSPGTTELYGDGTVDPISGMAERPVAAPGSMNHSPGKAFAARQSYSLRPNAKFEESVTIAIQRLHLEMAHYCAEGWKMESQWTEADRRREGDYYLHYRFRCAG